MPSNRIITYFGRILAVWIGVAGLVASEHHGVVKAGGIPVPGATVTAVQGDKKQATTTDDDGAYSFADLDDGVWTINVEMLGFGKISREVGVAPEAPSPVWDLKMLSAAELKTALAPPPPPAPATAPAAPPAQSAAATPAPAAPAGKTASNGTAPKADATAAAASTPSGGRGNANGGGRGTQGGNRPSIRAAAQQQGNSFQRVDVNSTGDLASAGPDLGLNMPQDNGTGAGDAMVINGSVNSDLGMAQQNDWGGGFGGRGGDMSGFGGPGGMAVINGGGQPGGDNAGGPGGGMRGGPGGGGPGGGGGMPGGFGGGMRGGGGFPGGGRGGPGGPGGRGGRGGRGQNNASFGNGRRTARPRYNTNLAFSLNNSIWDARPFSLTGADTPKPATAVARFTASTGGPLKIPHLLSGDKTTFFLNYQLTRGRNGITSSSLVPTADERDGIFTGLLNPQTLKPVTIYDPTTGNPFPNNVIPQNRISSQAMGLLNYYPQPNLFGNSQYNYQLPLVSTTNQDNVNLRIMQTINAKNQVNGGVGYQRANGVNPNLFGFTDTTAQTAVNANVSYIYHFTTRVIDTLGYNFSRNTQRATPYFANTTNVSGNLGITGNDQDPNFYGPPSLNFSNSSFAGLTDGNLAVNRSQTSALSNSVLWIHGRHNLRIGGDFRRQQNNPVSESNPRGNFGFTGAATGPTAGVVGFDFADFLLGLPDTSAVAYGNADKYFRNSWFDGYVSDDWRITTKLSLQLGLRWEYQAPINELYGRLVNLNIGPDFGSYSTLCATPPANATSGGTCAAGSSAGLPDSLVRTNPHEIQPRLGFAWRPFPKHSTVVRGGYGVYYNTSVYQNIAQSMAQQSPLSYSLNDSSAMGLLTLANGFPQLNPVRLSTFAVDPNFALGYLHYWQVAVQQSLPGALVSTLTYNGSKGTHQPETFVPNSNPGATAYPCVTAQTCPSNLIYETSGGNSNLELGSAQLQRRFRSGFSGNVIYTFAHAIDEGNVGGRGGAGSIAQDWLDLNAERANSNLARRHSLNMQMQYSTGVGTRGGTLLKGWKGTLIKDWTLTTNVTVSSGAFLTPTILSRTLGGSAITGPLRADFTGAPIYLDGVLNPLAFVAPPSGSYGDAGRDTITGPTTFSLNGSAGRIFRVGERRNIDLRFDSTNALNHVNFGSYNTTVGSRQFGILQSPNAMRSFTATLRFRF